MSVVAYRNGVIAADRQATSYGLVYPFKKVRRHGNTIYACTGKADQFAPLIAWHSSGADVGKWPEFQKGDDWSRLIVVNAGGVMVYEQQPWPIQIEHEYMAWGAGADFAMGAMFAGSNAVDAVFAANQHSNACGLGVDFERFEPCDRR